VVDFQVERQVGLPAARNGVAFPGERPVDRRADWEEAPAVAAAVAAAARRLT
jgi:hypothetical protein